MNKELLQKIFNAPGLFTPSELRITANDLEGFLVQFKKWEEIFGSLAMHKNVLDHQINVLRKTADLVKERDK